MNGVMAGQLNIKKLRMKKVIHFSKFVLKADNFFSAKIFHLKV